MLVGARKGLGGLSSSSRSSVQLCARINPRVTSWAHQPACSSRVVTGSLNQQYLRRTITTTPGSSLKQTPLYDMHVKHGAKMVPFGGYSMPVQYVDLGVGESHAWTREKASIFDVSHM